jgi:zinc protease
MRVEKGFSRILLPAVLLAVSCGPGVTSGGPASTPETEFIDAKVSYIETATPAAPAAKAKKVPMPEIKADFNYAFPDVHEKTLKNGMKIYHVDHSRLPLVSIEAVFRAGSAYDPAGLPGLAVFTGEMLKGGTKTRSARQVAEAFESLGMSLGVWTDYDATILQVTCLKEHVGTALELLADILVNPTFPDDEIEILRTRELGRLTLMKSDPGWLADRQIAAEIYGSHPYARYDATEESIQKIVKKDVKAFHAKAFCGANGFLTIVGDIGFDEAKKIAASRFAKLPKGTLLKMKKAAIPAPTKTSIVIVDRPGSVQTVFKIGAASVKRKSADFVPLLVADYVLGGSPSSRLFMRVREKESLAYHVGSRLTESVDRGTWTVEGSTSTASTAKALASILEEIGRIGAETMSAEENDEAVAFLTGSFALRIETTDQVAALVSDMAVFGLPGGYWETYMDAVRKTGPEQAKATAAPLLDPGKLVVVLVGDAAQLKPLLGAYSDISVVSP